jgi:hypothetical protein
MLKLGLTEHLQSGAILIFPPRAILAFTAALAVSGIAHAQDFAAAALPDAPSAMLQDASQPPAQPAVQSSAQLTGIIRDVEGSPVPQAHVTLAAPGILGERSVTADADGAFAFSGVAAGEYRLLVTASGLTPFTSAEFVVRPGESEALPTVVLKLAPTTSVDVVATPDQIAVAEVHEEEKQRFLGVFPNFYTSYIWDAAPLPTNQKYKLAAHSVFDPFGFVLLAGVAGVQQAANSYSGYHQGMQGYGKRYGAAFAENATSRIIGGAILPSLLHQDPRYFYQGSGGFRSRLRHALLSTIVCRGDDRKDHPNYSHILGSLAAAGIANAYLPSANRGVGTTFSTFALTLGGFAGDNFFREFVLRGFVPSVPGFANGKAVAQPAP